MRTFHTVIHDRRIELPAPPEMPDGTEVLVVLTSADAKIGLDESEWEDDPQALAEWSAWLETIEPVTFAERDEFGRIFIELKRIGHLNATNRYSDCGDCIHARQLGCRDSGF